MSESAGTTLDVDRGAIGSQPGSVARARRWPGRLVTAFYWFVAMEFLLGAITKYWPGPGPFGQDYAVKFEYWGYPSGFRFVVGSLELICAVMLVIPRRRTRFLAASGLVFVLTGAVTTHIVVHDPLSESISAPLHLLIAVAIALANWPADWRMLLRPWRKDPVNGARAAITSDAHAETTSAGN